MAILEVKNLNFRYTHRSNPALKGLNLSFKAGDFNLICGPTGGGKTTLLRHFKPALAPHGKKEGEILYRGQPIEGLSSAVQAGEIGYVMQSPEHQIVTDNIWHELAFGLENLGLDQRLIQLRVAEMVSFFGIEAWLEEDISRLSGGQKQLLNLAAVLALYPRLLLLDEPTAQLDPVAAGDFIATLKRVNRELGISIILSEQRMEEFLPAADYAVMLEEGRIAAQGHPRDMAKALFESKNPLAHAMPAAARLYGALDGQGAYPLTVKEGRQWFHLRVAGLMQPKVAPPPEGGQGESILELKKAWFRYEKHTPDVIKNLSFKIPKARISCILGGNGSGKTTALTLLAGLNRPYRGQMLLEGKPLKKYANSVLYPGYFGFLPQNPQLLFVKKTVGLDLSEMLDHKHINEKEKGHKIAQIAELLGIGHLLYVHPYDLSIGEQQKAALAKILLSEPKIILLDEPTKGLDGHFKQKLAEILHRLTHQGITIVMASHDIEFCAKFGDICSLFFDGRIVFSAPPQGFFSGNGFYTTSANRIAREHLPHAITVEEIIAACQSPPPQKKG